MKDFDNLTDEEIMSFVEREDILTIKNLKKDFGDHKVLRGIDFSLKPAEKVVVLGPSGSGKSTFLRCINHLETPTSGEILFHDVPVTNQNIRKVRMKIGMVFQHFNLINNLTVIQNLILAPVNLNLLDENTAIKKAHTLLRHIGLISKINAYPASLSGGEKQRIAIIRAMMMEPEILLFDEPTSALDPESIGDVLSHIRELSAKNLTLAIVTHEMGFAREIASRVIFLDNGKIIEENTSADFFTHPKTPRVEEFLKKVL